MESDHRFIQILLEGVAAPFGEPVISQITLQPLDHSFNGRSAGHQSLEPLRHGTVRRINMREGVEVDLDRSAFLRIRATGGFVLAGKAGIYAFADGGPINERLFRVTGSFEIHCKPVYPDESSVRGLSYPCPFAANRRRFL